MSDNSSNSLFYLDENGRKCDAGLHIDEPADPHGYAADAIERAVAGGMPRYAAERSFGVRVKLEPVDHDPFAKK